MIVKYTGPKDVGHVTKKDDDGNKYVWNATNKWTVEVPDNFGHRLVDSSVQFEEVKN